MRRACAAIIGLVLFGFTAGSAHADVIGVPLDEVLSGVQQTLIKIRDAADADTLPSLQSVVLDLRASFLRQANGEVKVVILEVGAHGSSETTQEIKLTLSPPSPGDRSKVAAS